jgi:hypothetical protein
MQTIFIDFKSNGYDFTIVVDADGVRVGSIESLKDRSIEGLNAYRDALYELSVRMVWLNRYEKV